MTTTTARRRTLKGGRRLRDGHNLYWWGEIIAIVVFYMVYSAVRNTNEGSEAEAYHHATQVISFERAIGIFHEQTFQEWALHFKPLIIAANYFYGSLHFIVTIFAALLLYRRFSDDYPQFRNTLAVSTGIALIGFVTFPLMPPRLLDAYAFPHFGIHYGFVDTLAKYPTIWSFNSGAASKISNQFAAMPSVHICWATWAALAIAPRVKPTWAKVLAIVYPFMTLVVIVITANHYIIDAAGGLLILAIGWPIAHALTRAGRGKPIEEQSVDATESPPTRTATGTD